MIGTTTIDYVICQGFLEAERAREFREECRTQAVRQLKKKMLLTGEQNIANMMEMLYHQCFLFLQDSFPYKEQLVTDLRAGRVQLTQLLQQEENINSDWLQKERDVIKILQESKVEYKESKLYQCERCESRKIITEQHQNRSSDEPATIYFRCTDCEWTRTR